MILKFGDLVVFSASRILLFINDLVVDHSVGLMTCVRIWFNFTVTLV